MNTYTPGNDRIVHETSVDFVTRKFFEPVYLTQYDNTIPVLKVNLYYNRAPYAIPSTLTANIRVGKPDHTFVYSPALGKSSDGKSVYFAMTQQMLVFYGERCATIEIADANPGSATEIAGASPVHLIIEPNSIQEGDLESSTEFSTAEEFAERAEEAYEATAATTATATVDANVGTPSVTVTKTIVDGHLNLAFAFQNMKGNTGVSIVSVTKTGTSGNVDTYTITFSNGETTTFTITNGNVSSVNGQTGAVVLDAFDVGAVSSVNGRTGVVTGLAEQDGYYDTLTAGTAEQILSTVSVNDKVPYLFRTSGGNADIGNRELDKLVGGTIAWNQQMKGNVFASLERLASHQAIVSVSNNVATITGDTDGATSTALRVRGISIFNGYKYLVTFKVKPSKNTNTHIATINSDDYSNVTPYSGSIAISQGEYNIVSFIINGSQTYRNCEFWLYVCDSVIPYNRGDTADIKDLMFIDLTQMFGSTVADYIYSLEQSHAGDGVAFVRPFIENADKSYNAGELVSVETSAHETVGFNQWDEEWELGAISTSTGQNYNSTTLIRSKNYNICLPNTNYYCNCPENTTWVVVYFYDNNQRYISYTASKNSVFTTPINAGYFRISPFDDYGTTYNHDICINLSHSGYRNGEYESYVKHTYALDSDLELRGILKLGASNKLYYDGDEYASDGTVTRRYGIVDLGTLTWGKDSEYNVYYAASSLQNASKNIGNVICPNYIASSVPYYDRPDKTISLRSDGGVTIRDISFHGTATKFKTAMSGVYLVYELDTPTTEAADPFTNPQIVNDFGTEKYVDERDVPVPVGHDTDYPANLRDKLQRLPNIPAVDGDYIARVTNGQASFITKVNELPTIPTTGTFTLKATNGVLSWVTG